MSCGQIVGQRGNDARRARGFGGVNGEADFVQRRLGLDDDGIRAGFNQRPGLFLVGGARLFLRQVAVRFQDRAERAKVAEHKTLAPAKRLARDADARLVDGAQVIGMVVPLEHDAAAAKRVGDEAIRARFRVTPLDAEHAVGMGQVPVFAATALFEAREHELRAHRAVADQTAFAQGFLKGFFHLGFGFRAWPARFRDNQRRRVRRRRPRLQF